MDESLSWQASLARKNINILNVDFNDQRTVATVYYEFMYHPYSGQTKWSKTFTEVKGDLRGDKDSGWYYQPIEGRNILNKLGKEVLSLRKELES